MRLGDQEYHLYPDSSGGLYEFTVKKFSGLVDDAALKTPGDGKVIPKGFVLSRTADGQSGPEAWYMTQE
jgi:hypothetical protein